MKRTLTIMRWKSKKLMLMRIFWKDSGSAKNKVAKVSQASRTKDKYNLMSYLTLNLKSLHNSPMIIFEFFTFLTYPIL